MGARIRAHDWSRNPLGPVETWPHELRTTVGVMLESHFPMAIVWGPELITLYNDAFRPILGQKPEALGRSFGDVWAEVWDQIGPLAKQVFAGEAVYIEDYPLRIERGGAQESAWFTFSYSPIRMADGSVGGLLDTVVETTATVKGRIELSTANQELGHRIKNILATVQAVAGQSLREVTERAAVERFQDRIVAMGRAQDVLLRAAALHAGLRAICEATLGPFDSTRQIRVSGPDVEIGPHAAFALALLLHELATNAAKYGALTAPDGRVDLAWTVKGERLLLTWRESDGPHVTPPSRTGFGSRLIQLGLGPGSKVTRRF